MLEAALATSVKLWGVSARVGGRLGGLTQPALFARQQSHTFPSGLQHRTAVLRTKRHKMSWTCHVRMGVSMLYIAASACYYFQDTCVHTQGTDNASMVDALKGKSACVSQRCFYASTQ